MDRFVASAALLLNNGCLFLLAALVDLLAGSGRPGVRPALFLAVAVWTLPALVTVLRTPLGTQPVALVRVTASALRVTWLVALCGGVVAAVLTVRLRWPAGSLAYLCVAVATLVEGWSLSRRLQALARVAPGRGAGSVRLG